MKLVFAGTPDFSVPALDALVQSGHDVVAVLTQPDRPAGRGRKLRASPVADRAAGLGIETRKPESLRRNESLLEELRAMRADAMVVVAYGLILPQRVLDIPVHGCLNIHASLLPRWRGAAPIQRAILAGDKETGITIMRMERGLDTGPMLLVDRLPIHPESTAGDLHDALASMGARLIVQALEGITSSSITPRVQPEVGVTYAEKIDKSEAKIDWSSSADAIRRQIHAFNPAPGAWSPLAQERVKLLTAESSDRDTGAAPGKAIALDKSGLRIACGRGTLTVTQLQRPGGRANSPASALQGFDLDALSFG